MTNSARQQAVRLSPEQFAWLDKVALQRQKAGGDMSPSRSSIIRELVAWAMREDFFGTKRGAK